MNNYNTYLDTSSKKNRCPYCHQKTLTLYLTSDKKEIINENVGRVIGRISVVIIILLNSFMLIIISPLKKVSSFQILREWKLETFH